MARNPFWTYTLRVYGRPGVSPSLIALQDNAGADVNLLLFCLWAGHNRMTLSAAAMSAALTVSGGWRTAMRPLRQARRALKPLGVDALRKSLLRLEVQAERLQQDRLFAIVRTVKAGKGEPAMIAADNLGLYFRKGRIRLTRRDWASLQAIIRAAFSAAE